MNWIIASLISSFVLGTTVGYFLAKHHFFKEQLARESEEKNSRLWIDYLKTFQGGSHE